MRIGLRLLLAFFLVLGLALVVVLQVFVEEVKPGTQQAMEDSLVDAANALALVAAPAMKAGTLPRSDFARAMTALSHENPRANIWGFEKSRIDYRVTVTDAKGLVVFDSRGQDVGKDHSQWNDVLRTLRGEYGARSSGETADDRDRTVMHVAAPIRDGDRIVGVLTVSRPNHTLAPYIERSRNRILRWSWGVMGLSLVIGLLFTWWIASSLSRLRRYATAVAQGERAELPRMGRLSGNTEFADLAQAVERMRLRLEDKAYVENYVHTLTHELKSPLAAIRGASELLQEPLPEAERQRFAGNIRRQTERLQQLIDRLLTLADVEQMRHLRTQEPVDLVALTRDALHTAEPRLQQKGLRVDWSPAQTDGEPLRPATVVGDRFLLAQALQNLLDNAIDFSPPGGQLTLTLTPDAGREVAGWAWTLRDQGPGVPDYAMDRVFDRFYSLVRPDSQDKSSGLGLCLVKEVTELHGGDIRLDNVNDPVGCRVVWWLPVGR
jgi:two-component system sensor histidine kinase CreC